MYSHYNVFIRLYRVKFGMDNLSSSRSGCEFEYWHWLSQEELFSGPSVERQLFHFHVLVALSCPPSFYDGRSHERCCSHFSILRLQSQHTVYSSCKAIIMLYMSVAKPTSYCTCIFPLHNQHHTKHSSCTTNIILYIPVAQPTSYCAFRLHKQHHIVHPCCTNNTVLYIPVAQPTSHCTFRLHNPHHIFWGIFACSCNFEAAMFTRIWIGYRLWSVGNWRFISYRVYWASLYYRGADKSLARPGRKQATATEYVDFHISYL